jgi:surface antigen
LALLVAGSGLLGGCSMSMSDDSPKATSSIAAPVEVQQPLPQTLAYSDATKIGQTAAAALLQVDNGQDGEWVNKATGSSGTVVESASTEAAELSGACRLFNTIVTSFSGVHRYSGKVCRADNGRSVVQIDPQAGGVS